MWQFYSNSGLNPIMLYVKDGWKHLSSAGRKYDVRISQDDSGNSLFPTPKNWLIHEYIWYTLWLILSFKLALSNLYFWSFIYILSACDRLFWWRPWHSDKEQNNNIVQTFFIIKYLIVCLPMHWIFDSVKGYPLYLADSVLSPILVNYWYADFRMFVINYELILLSIYLATGQKNLVMIFYLSFHFSDNN